MKSVLILVAFLAAAWQQSPTTPNHGDMFKRGAWHREVAETSPFAREEIEQTTPKPGGQFKLSIRATVHNLTDNELVYVNPAQYYDVYDKETGKRAPETPSGCYGNFFLDCYEPTLPAGTSADGPPKDIVPAHGSIENINSGYLDMDWQLAPGTYTVVGYYCATKREGPECFKSNKIEITIPKPVQ